jgi:N-formylglutamate amidohydrolase
MQHPAYKITLPPERLTPVVMASPHSGRDYPQALIRNSVLDFNQLRSSEDAFVDRLIDMAPDHGAPVIAARCPRAYVDFNRAPDELDPALIEGLARSPHNPRISSGLGVIPRVVSGGRAIYRGKMHLSEAEARISGNWHPYHQALRRLLEETHGQFGQSVLIDWHSMPHEAIENHGRPGALRPEVVLGDRFGASAGSDWTDRIEAAFQDAGLRVARNSPFAGAFVAQSYGLSLIHI